MQWYEGDISEAVNKVNEPNKFLVVFLRDESSSSTVYSDIFEKSQEMHKVLINCICLNLLKGKTEYQQFSDVYKVTEVPSIYVVSHLGQVVDIIKDEIDHDQLISRLRKNWCTELNVENDSNGAGNSVGSGETESPDRDLKMIEIRQKLAEKHRQKLEEEKAKEIEDELNRREHGKKLAELKKLQKDQEENDIKEDIRRQRQEDKDARSKVLRQIEEDKLERKNRFVKQEATSAVIVAADNIDEVEVRHRATEGQYLSARLQFRFPDGSSRNNTFDCQTQFAVVRQFVTEHVRQTMENRKFEIKQFFPKKTINETDDILSLSDLKLVPSASLAVIFVDGQLSSSSQGSSLVNLLLSPINHLLLTLVSLIQWVRLRVFGGGPVVPGGGGGGTVAAAHRNQPQTVTDNLANWEERQRRLLAAESRTIKKDGNLAQFSDTNKDKEDKDDATWNGNSTQQW